MTVFVTPPKTAVMVTGVGTLTAVVWIANVTKVCPAGTMAVIGTAATDGFELLRDTEEPPFGALPFRLTRLSVVVVPPFVAVGDAVTPVNTAGVTVVTAVRVTPPYVADSVTGVAAATGFEVDVK